MALSHSAIGLDAFFPAQPTQVAAIRRAVRDVAVGGDADAETLIRLGLAVSEAATNVVLHAYRDGLARGAIHVTASITAGALEVSIGDDGVGMSPRPDSPGLGLGLSLMASEADRFEVHCTDGGGTRIVLHFELGLPDAASTRFARTVEAASAPAGA
jgi:anti-sigma regulatory factor (Ser/Thr protein kinase)